jgi:hypothetical protein
MREVTVSPMRLKGEAPRLYGGHALAALAPVLARVAAAFRHSSWLCNFLAIGIRM